MTIAELIRLEDRATLTTSWRWLPGMLAKNEDGLISRIVEYGEAIWQEPNGWWGLAVASGPFRAWVPASPVLKDPATLGCLLALVREAWGIKDLIARPTRQGWDLYSVWLPVDLIHLWAETETELLVNALEQYDTWKKKKQ